MCNKFKQYVYQGSKMLAKDELWATIYATGAVCVCSHGEWPFALDFNWNAITFIITFFRNHKDFIVLYLKIDIQTFSCYNKIWV